jgi:uncharacterized membrane protein
MSERCHVCNARTAEHSCYRCGNSVCSSCIDENGLLCRNCRFTNEDEMEGIKIGYAPLKKMANMPLLIAGIAVIITGMIVMMSASFVSSASSPQQQPGGFIYIFPFPFVFGWGSPDMITVLPLIVAMLALPVIMILLMFRKFTRS